MPIQSLLRAGVVLGLVRVEGLIIDSLNVRLTIWKMFMLSHGLIFRINKIEYSKCSIISHYTPMIHICFNSQLDIDLVKASY